MTRDQHRSDAGAWPWPAPVAPLALDPWQYAGPYDPERSGLEPLQLRQQDGKALRKLVPYRAHGAWKPPADRPDPVQVLMKTNEGRQQEFVPIRMGRMAASPPISAISASTEPRSATWSSI